MSAPEDVHAKIRAVEQRIAEKREVLRPLNAKRKELNDKVYALKTELERLYRPSDYVGEVAKMVDEKMALVKVRHEGKFIVNVKESLRDPPLKSGMRVACHPATYAVEKILPSKVDPLVSMMLVEKTPDATFDMIGGLAEQIQQVKEVIELPITHPELFDALGIPQPKGVLLYGPPGTGKTLLARAVARESKCAFIRVSGSELVQKYIGEGARLVRELFVMAREHAPSIIFMDEIDSIGATRHKGKGDSEVQRTMMELLNQLDGFEPSKNIKMIMATNRIDVLDPALLRPGRIDRKIEFPAPDAAARLEILKIHSRTMSMEGDVDLQKIADTIQSLSGAEVKAVCTEAGMFALREGRSHVRPDDFELAVGKVTLASKAESRKTYF